MVEVSKNLLPVCNKKKQISCNFVTVKKKSFPFFIFNTKLSNPNRNIAIVYTGFKTAMK